MPFQSVQCQYTKSPSLLQLARLTKVEPLPSPAHWMTTAIPSTWDDHRSSHPACTVNPTQLITSMTKRFIKSHFPRYFKNLFSLQDLHITQNIISDNFFQKDDFVFLQIIYTQREGHTLRGYRSRLISIF